MQWEYLRVVIDPYITKPTPIRQRPRCSAQPRQSSRSSRSLLLFFKLVSGAEQFGWACLSLLTCSFRRGGRRPSGVRQILSLPLARSCPACTVPRVLGIFHHFRFGPTKKTFAQGRGQGGREGGGGGCGGVDLPVDTSCLPHLVMFCGGVPLDCRRRGLFHEGW